MRSCHPWLQLPWRKTTRSPKSMRTSRGRRRSANISAIDAVTRPVVRVRHCGARHIEQEGARRRDLRVVVPIGRRSLSPPPTSSPCALTKPTPADQCPSLGPLRAAAVLPDERRRGELVERLRFAGDAGHARSRVTMPSTLRSGEVTFGAGAGRMSPRPTAVTSAAATIARRARRAAALGAARGAPAAPRRPRGRGRPMGWDRRCSARSPHVRCAPRRRGCGPRHARRPHRSRDAHARRPSAGRPRAGHR